MDLNDKIQIAFKEDKEVLIENFLDDSFYQEICNEFPKVDFFLVDSIGKKIKVVRAVTKDLGLKNVKISHVRAENINEKFDVGPFKLKVIRTSHSIPDPVSILISTKMV